MSDPSRWFRRRPKPRTVDSPSDDELQAAEVDPQVRAAAVRALRETPAAELAVRRADLEAQARAAGFSHEEIMHILGSRPDLPRTLLPEERATLLAVLNDADFPGRAALLAQAATAYVTGYCSCPCASVALAVDRTLAPAEHSTSPLGTSPTVRDADGEPIGGVLIFLDDGYLAYLEIYTWTGSPISPFPPTSRLLFDGP